MSVYKLEVLTKKIEKIYRLCMLSEKIKHTGLHISYICNI